MSDAAERRAELERRAAEWRGCQKCALAAGRTQVVVGVGDPDADLMFVGEAPGFHEDRQGIPFVGQAGKLLESLLGEIGLSRDRVYIANVLKCRPPGNRDPQPDEIDACEEHLFAQVELIQPRVVCTLGNFATKLLTASRMASRASTASRNRIASAPSTSSSTRSSTRQQRSTRRPCWTPFGATSRSCRSSSPSARRRPSRCR